MQPLPASPSPSAPFPSPHNRLAPRTHQAALNPEPSYSSPLLEPPPAGSIYPAFHRPINSAFLALHVLNHMALLAAFRRFQAPEIFVSRYFQIMVRCVQTFKPSKSRVRRFFKS
jgi:hypothetical protein